MLKYMCILRPQKAEGLCERLMASDKAHDVRAVEIRGRGRRGERSLKQGGPLEYIPKVAVTLYADAADHENIIDMIQSTCRSGHPGDGKIFVYPIENVISF